MVTVLSFQISLSYDFHLKTIRVSHKHLFFFQVTLEKNLNCFSWFIRYVITLKTKERSGMAGTVRFWRAF